MGSVKQEETHGKRSSSMSFAMRWKHGNLRLITLSAAISIAMTFMFLVLLYGTAVKSVTVVVNGEETVVETRQWDLQRLLDEQAIAIGPHDEVSVPFDSSIKDGDRIVLTHAIPVSIKADGKIETVHTTNKTVEGAIQEAAIAIGDEDKVSPAMDTVLQADEEVTIVRVDTKLKKAEHIIPFSVVKTEDADLEVGKEKLVQTGQKGLKIEKIEEKYEDGVLVSNKSISEIVERKAQDQIVAIGTKKPEPKVTILSNSSPSIAKVSKDGEDFNAKKVLKNVTLTAYHAGKESTGKGPGDPYYRKTASGTEVTEGKTIAVDPKVIPMGWWVYIDGIGFRRAEDKGGAIKGNKIDVFFESPSKVKKFGRKKGYTVYVIGPKKPVSS
ncbi:ubiquitin-like domain-containing protein [Paenibacillus yanchengensis]|uniref:Ubiquitin-like domain-containing protein n=1 Tax=Paenibacillus yanchengensis TaxID=2035833 RepID=A0ABW4YIP7_9BACL